MKPTTHTVDGWEAELKSIFNDNQNEPAPMIPYVWRQEGILKEIINYVTTLIAQAKEEERKRILENLKNAMDEYNSLPEGAFQFAFYLKVTDTRAFFEYVKTGKNSEDSL